MSGEFIFSSVEGLQVAHASSSAAGMIGDVFCKNCDSVGSASPEASNNLPLLGKGAAVEIGG